MPFFLVIYPLTYRLLSVTIDRVQSKIDWHNDSALGSIPKRVLVVIEDFFT